MRRNISSASVGVNAAPAAKVRENFDKPVSPSRSRPIVAARKPIGLALQGGGSWGAYTWGVLDALLASRSVVIAQLSGTSAGAINAAIVASALAKGSSAEARKALRSFWLRVADPALADLARRIWGPAERSMRQSFGAWLLSSGAVTPYNSNPLGLNPLRDAIEAHVDIDAIRSNASPALFVTVTNVKTGLPRVIANDAMSIDALLASACVPELFQAVELDGERYWDGGYCGNPTLWPMIHSALADDLIVVQLAPEFAEVPTDGHAIRRRVGEIIFNSSLVAEMQAITAMRVLAERNADSSHLLSVRMHRIGPPREELHDQGTSMERSRAWLQLLEREGRAAGKRFLSSRGADIGVRETLDVAGAFSDGHKPKLRPKLRPKLGPKLPPKLQPDPQPNPQPASQLGPSPSRQPNLQPKTRAVASAADRVSGERSPPVGA